jgi:hypothetical protein
MREKGQIGLHFATETSHGGLEKVFSVAFGKLYTI